MLNKGGILAIFLLVHLIGFGIAREGVRPLTIEDIEPLLKEGVSAGRVAMVIRERGLSFEGNIRSDGAIGKGWSS